MCPRRLWKDIIQGSPKREDGRLNRFENREAWMRHRHGIYIEIAVRGIPASYVSLRVAFIGLPIMIPQHISAGVRLSTSIDHQGFLLFVDTSTVTMAYYSEQ